jgi:hypothetical protein
MTTNRPITNADLWAAIRGLGMGRMDKDELLKLAADHADKPLFASQVIAEAARQVAATRRATQ